MSESGGMAMSVLLLLLLLSVARVEVNGIPKTVSIDVFRRRLAVRWSQRGLTIN